MKTATIVLEDIKDHSWWDLLLELGLVQNLPDDSGSQPSSPEAGEKVKRHFKYGEYASIEIEVDENLKIVGGRILPRETRE